MKILDTSAIAFFRRIGLEHFSNLIASSMRSGAISALTMFVMQLSIADTSISFCFMSSLNLTIPKNFKGESLKNWDHKNIIVFCKMSWICTYLLKEIRRHEETLAVWVDRNRYLQTS